MLLTVAKEQLAPWIHDRQPDAALFDVMAQIPMQWMETGAPQKDLPIYLEELLRRSRGIKTFAAKIAKRGPKQVKKFKWKFNP